jgi:hypothetical protein
MRAVAILWANLLVNSDALAASAHAPNEPPEHSRVAVATVVPLSDDPLPHFALGSVRVVLGQTTLDDVHVALLSGAVQHSGDAANSSYWLCYTVLEPSAARMWILSDGEMGGVNHAVTGLVAMEIRGPMRVAADCPTLPQSARTPVLSNGITLGSSRPQIGTAFGKVPIRARWTRYEFQKSGIAQATRSDERLDIQSQVDVKVCPDRVCAIVAHRIESD